MTDVDTYRSRACELRTRANACPTAAEAAPFIEMAVAWEKLADDAEASRRGAEAAEG